MSTIERKVDEEEKNKLKVEIVILTIYAELNKYCGEYLMNHFAQLMHILKKIFRI